MNLNVKKNLKFPGEKRVSSYLREENNFLISKQKPHMSKKKWYIMVH